MRKRRSIKAGLPPGSMVYVGKDVVDPPRITHISYDEEGCKTQELPDFNEAHFSTTKEKYNWINITGLSNVQLIKNIGDYFKLHVLTQEDILNTEQRAKLESYESYTYIVLKMLYYDKDKRTINGEQLSIVLIGNTLITFQEFRRDAFDGVRERIKTAGTRIRKNKVDFLAYALMDAVIDNYFLIMEQMGDNIDELEVTILNNPNQQVMKQLYALKRNIVLMRKSVWPLREVVSSMERMDKFVFHSNTKVFIRDLYDHTIQVLDSNESMRDIVTGLVDIYLTTINNNMSSVMKVLTIISTIFIPLTFIAGVYGMNFLFMPELEWRWSYPVILVVMVTIAIGMILFFKNKKWL